MERAELKRGAQGFRGLRKAGLAIALLVLVLGPGDRSTGAPGLTSSGSMWSAINVSAPGSLVAGTGQLEFLSPLVQAPMHRGRSGVLPVVHLHVDEAMRHHLGREVRRAGGDEVMLRDFVLAPDQPGGAPQFVDLHVSSIPVFSEFAQFVDGSKPGGPVFGGFGEALPKPDVLLLGGEVAGHPDSQVFLSMSSHGTHGFVRRGSNVQIISSGPEGQGRETLIYDSLAMPEGAIPWRDFVCDVHNVPQNAGAAAARALGGGGFAGGAGQQCRRAVIAVETDHEFTANLFGGNTSAAAAYAATLIAAASEIFNSHIGVNLQIGFVRLWSQPNDPWSGGGTGAQLSEFQSYWNENMTGVPRHLAHFLSGKSLGGGVAFLNGLCHATNGYAVSADLNGFFPYPLQNNSPQNWDIVVVAHEFGHNFGVLHTHDYCPTPLDQCASGGAVGNCQSATVCQTGTIMSYCHTCPPGMANIILQFHPQIAADMLAFVDSIPPSTCSLACDPWTVIPEGDFCVPNSPMPCPEPEKKPAGWDDWEQLLRNDGLGAFKEEELDNYGLAVAVDGDLAIVAAPRHDRGEPPEDMYFEVGAAYIFRYVDEQWREVAKLEPPSVCNANFLRFGEAVAIASSPNEDVAVIGAPRAIVDDQMNRGAVWVFRRTGPVWPSAENWQMENVIIEEDDDDDKKGSAAGERESLCDLSPRLVASDGFAGDSFGASVAIMPFRIDVDFCGGGDVIVVGAPHAWPLEECLSGVGIDSGAAYVYRYDPLEGKWREESKLVPICTLLAEFGISVSIGYSSVLNEEIIVGGAWLAPATAFPEEEEKDDPKNGDPRPPGPPEPITIDFAGSVYVFRNSTFIDGDGTVSAYWFAESALSAEHPRIVDLFGISVDFASAHDDGDLLIVGSPGRDLPDEEFGHLHDDLATDEGGAFILRRVFGGLWTEEAELFGFEPRSGSLFGSAVGISGNMAVVGAHGQPGPDPDPEAEPDAEIMNVGAAYVYRYFGGEWNDEVELLPTSQYAGQGPDDFGISVGISRNAIVVGSRREHENDLPGAGAAYMYGRCPPPCPGSGSCFGPNPTPGCGTIVADCCDQVCAKMPFCCEGFWGLACVAEAMTICGGCGDAGSGSCTVANETPGCATTACCSAVCAIDEFCCAEAWDQSCVDLAVNIDACTAFSCPGEGDCMSAHAGAGCEDEACCEAVCSADPFCCQVSWDPSCALQAVKLCEEKKECDGDLTGDGSVGVFDLLELLGSWGPCPDCDDCPADITGVTGKPDCVVNIFDLLALLGGWGPCD